MLIDYLVSEAVLREAINYERMFLYVFLNPLSLITLVNNHYKIITS